jgi:hypothetical protein
MENNTITYSKAVSLRVKEIMGDISLNKLSELSLIPVSTLHDLIHEVSEFPSQRAIIEFCRYFKMELAEFYDSPYFYLEFLQSSY